MLTAACRKVLIGTYHLRALRRYRSWAPSDLSDTVPIPLQAHFEGILAALFSAIDKVAGYYGERDASKLFADGPHGELVADPLRSWYTAPIVAHARKLRNDATHNYYGKMPGKVGLRVPSHRELWVDAPTDLFLYATAVVAHLATLGAMIGCPVTRPPKPRQR